MLERARLGIKGVCVCVKDAKSRAECLQASPAKATLVKMMKLLHGICVCDCHGDLPDYPGEGDE
jgi:hypothetical protein